MPEIYTNSIHFDYFCKVEKFCEHIEKLLAQHDYVVVPNLGGFVVQSQSAKILDDHITPPQYTIGFNPLMHHADGLLAIEIARSKQISYRMAMEYIEKQVEALKFNLHSKGDIQFGKLGIFHQNDAGNLLFLPVVKVDFLPLNFELTNIYVSQRNKQLNSEKPSITITFPSARIFKYASAAMLIVGLLCISPRMSDMRRVDNADLVSSAFYNSSQKPVSKIDSSLTVKSSETILPTDSDNYHIIVASLPNQKTADEYCHELVATDFPSAHVLPPTKTYRVAIQSFSEREIAIQFMEKLRKTDKRFETAWVYCKN